MLLYAKAPDLCGALSRVRNLLMLCLNSLLHERGPYLLRESANGYFEFNLA